MTALIAVDWGTSNRRIYRIEEGRVVARETDARGVTTMAQGGYVDEILALRRRYGELPMLLAGMVGSTIGWATVPYVDAPAGLPAIAARVHWIDARTAIIPGVAWRDGRRGDVMRGEEVQILGAFAAGLVPADALVCQPGTHCKWVTLAESRITSFETAMTGEVFAVLKAHSVLASQLRHDVTDGPAFAKGAGDSARGDLLGGLFGVRASGVLGLRADADAASYVSGLLIGSDARARDVGGKTVYLIADAGLGDLYARAIGLLGGHAVRIASESAFVAGVSAIGELCL